MRHETVWCAIVVILFGSMVPAAESGASLPPSLVQNGDVELASGWDTGGGTIAPGGNPGGCLRFDRPGGARQDVLVAGRDLTLTVAVDVQVAEVVPEQGKGGYAFAAVYQTDERGKLVAFHDFVQLTGTGPWNRHSYTFRVHPEADFVSLRCGLFQAKGIACFDNWTLVVGTEPKRIDEVEPPARRSHRPGGAAAILREPGMPVQGAASSPETLAKILEGAGFDVRLLSADELADPIVFNASQFDLVVLPTGATFPAEARLAMVDFLRSGGGFLALGGYAFNRLVRKVDGKWIDEAEFVDAQLDEAMRAERSLIPGGGFEEDGAVALDGPMTEGQWRRTSELCTIVDESPHEGRFCAKASVPEGVANPSPQLHLDLPAEPGTVYRLSGWVRTDQVTGPGMAFIALYQYAADDQLVRFRDFARISGTTEWQRYDYRFTPDPGVTRLHVKAGLYQARGTAWFDDLRLGNVTGVEFRPMNTSTGTPADGLDVSPAQIGAFDASFPLKRACTLKTAPGQHVVREPVERKGDLRGWAASGVIGSDNARWIPLLQTYDRYGRPRGAAAAMILNYKGFYAGSCWAYFGVENVDLLEDPQGPTASAIAQVARFMRRKLFLRNLATDHRLYREGEPVTASVVVDNRGSEERPVRLRFSLAGPRADRPPATAVRELVVPSGTKEQVEVTFPEVDGGGDLLRVAVTLEADGEPIDELVTGVVLQKPSPADSGPELRFAENYFTLNGRPTFLFGTDTYARTYDSAAENPWTWHQELTAARDVGLNLYENLQYNKPGHKMSDDDWRSFRAMGRLTQDLNLVFMPGMLVGHNVAIGDAELEEQSTLCGEYARHLGDTPGLLYYINGDYQMRLEEHPEDVKTVWNRWLKEKYPSADALRAAWGPDAVRGELGNLDFPPPASGRWDDVAAVDRLRFQSWLLGRWNRAHVEAVRRHDARHPITSEYYSTPFAGIDLVMTIDGQDVSNIGFFDRPVDDIDNLPLKIRWNDLRARGKGVSLGEYGVKTHPAWTVENGAVGYHIVRTEEEQSRLFLAVAHYALGLGACKVQNWCLRDAQARVFPWGIFYPNQMIPKDVAYVHRNESIVWRHFRPVQAAPALTVCLANQLRLGNQEALGTTVAYRTFGDLLALHYDFNVIDDHHLDQIPAATQVIVYPAPFAVQDAAYSRWLAWVKQGGTLVTTGDFSYDADRQRTRPERLAELAGVEFVAEGYPNVARTLGSDVKAEFSLPGLDAQVVRPCIRVKPTSAEVLGATSKGDPVLVRNRVGRGVVYFFTDPIELGDDDPAKATRRRLYSTLLDAAKLKPLPVTPNEPWLHVMREPTARGTVHVVYNTKLDAGTEPVEVPTAAGPVTLLTRNRWPALAAATREGHVVAASAYGRASVGDEPLMTGDGLKALLSLDGEDLRRSQAILIAPFEPGRVELPNRSDDFVAIAGEFRSGKWTPLERLPLSGASLSIDVDADRATCLILVCPENTEARWGAQLTEAMLHPDRIRGY
ncbi:MAG TPA: beta-galactosidase trimerization domain-containing protein [Thermoguttaceae bacterium]|nr:beta-galactosidase trimerization domain-containing protein [Thermoguttaceae bacterium]